MSFMKQWNLKLKSLIEISNTYETIREKKCKLYIVYMSECVSCCYMLQGEVNRLTKYTLFKSIECSKNEKLVWKFNYFHKATYQFKIVLILHKLPLQTTLKQLISLKLIYL